MMSELYDQTLKKIHKLLNDKSHLNFFSSIFCCCENIFFAVAVSLFFLSQKKGGIDVTFNQYPFPRLSDCNSF